MADSELIVRLRGENSDLKQKLKEVTDASKGSATGMASSFGSALGSIASAIGITFSVGAVVNFAKQSVQAFSDSQAAAVSLANTVSNLGGSTGMANGLQGMIDSMEQMSGFDDSDLSAAFRDLYVQTGNAQKATEALNVAMNMAAIEHTTVAAASQKVFQVMSGLTRSMREFGMTTRNGATDMDYLRELGQKMANGLSTNLETVDGKTRKLKTSFDNLKEAIGGTMAASLTTTKGENIFDRMATDINFKVWLDDQFMKGNIESFDVYYKLFEMGKKYGSAWKQGMIEGGDLGSSSTTAPWYATVAGQLEHSGGITPKVVGSGSGSGSSVYKAAWEPINMVGGNLPELTKFIGNLRQASKVKMTVEVTVVGSGAKVPASDGKKIAAAVAPAVAAAVTHGQGWQPQLYGPNGGGGGAFKETR